MPPGKKRINLPKKFYFARCLGLGIGFFSVSFSLPNFGFHLEIFLVLGFYCFIWPHLAYFITARRNDPNKYELNNMLLDNFAVGFFSAAMGFNYLPTIAILTMASMNSMAHGGVKFFTKGLFFSIFGVITFITFFGFLEENDLSTRQIVACIPLLSLYPIALSYICYWTAMKVQSQKNEIKHMSRIDNLTGLLNRKSLNETIEEIITLSDYRKSQTIIALVDVDNFKSINDTHGHVEGDGVLKKLADLMLSCVRNCDSVGRYGGDEFVIILQGIDRSNAGAILERIRNLAEISFEENNIIYTPTLSIGAAFYDARFKTALDWLNAADAEMYKSKKKGRNRISFLT